MPKGSLIVAIFSACLIALFVTLVYLIRNIDPAVKSSDSIKFDDADYFLSPNEVFPSNGKLGYGLEKVTGEYDDDKPTKNISRIQPVCNNTDVKDALPNKKQTKYTKRQINIFEFITKPIKAVKGLRRSISNENQHEIDEESPRSLLFNIKDLDGQPRIEIKLIAENLNSKTSRKYRNSGTKIKTESKLSKINDVELDSDTTVNEASIVIVENGTFILNIFANSIDIFRENDTVSYESESNDTANATGDYNSQEIKNLDFNAEEYKMFSINTSLSTSSDGVNNTVLTMTDNLNLINNHYTTSNNSVTQNTTERLMSSLISEKDDKIFTMYNSQKPHLAWEGITEQSTVPFQYQTIAIVKEEISLNTELEEKTETTESIGSGEANDTDNLSFNLVGLLIPEAKATLPIDK